MDVSRVCDTKTFVGAQLFCNPLGAYVEKELPRLQSFISNTCLSFNDPLHTFTDTICISLRSPQRLFVAAIEPPNKGVAFKETHLFGQRLVPSRHT